MFSQTSSNLKTVLNLTQSDSPRPVKVNPNKNMDTEKPDTKENVKLK